MEGGATGSSESQTTDTLQYLQCTGRPHMKELKELAILERQ